MGRRESPVDPNAGPVQRFAYELRKLRQEAGGLTYRAMARGTEYSVTTLSRAAAGEQLPSLQVALAYATACGADAGEWERRWREASAGEAAVAAVADEDAVAPYQGLARFEPGDHERFFGRERLADEVLALVRAHRFSAVFGPSGSGKSSLLRAGLIPALRGERPAAVRILTPGRDPARTHAAVFTAKEGPGETVVVVDQFEEIFTLCADPEERKAFIDLALTALRPDGRLRVVLAVRADFYGRCAEHDALARALGATSLLVGPMNPSELREAIVGPAMASGLIVERRLTARVVAEVTGEPGGLPLMSHALLETWRRRRGRVLGEAAYDAAGGIHGAIARTAEDVYGHLTPVQAGVARRILLRLIAPGEGSQDTRRPVDRAELDTGREDDTAVVLERLVRARLLTRDASTVDLAHEALIKAWPRLASWIEEDREHLRVHRRLTEAARAWHDLGRDPGALYRGSRLATAEEHFAEDGRTEELTALERSFLAAGTAGRVRERRRLRGLVAALSLLLALAVLAGAVAWQQNRANDRRHTQAEARSIAAVADRMRFADPVKAMQLSVAAWRLADTAETRAALLGAMAQREQDTFVPRGADDGQVQNMLSADGRILVSAGPRWVRRWDTRTHKLLASLKGITAMTNPNLALSPDARILVAYGGDKDEGAVARSLSPGRSEDTRLPGLMELGDFGPSGRTLLIDNTYSGRRGQQSVRLLDVRHRRVLFERRFDGDTAAGDMAVSPGDRTVALCPEDAPMEMWDVARGRKSTVALTGHARTALCHSDEIRFTADGLGLAAGTDSGIRFWNLSSGRETPGIRHSGIKEYSFSRDGKFLAAVDADEILVWRVADPGAPVLRYPLVNESATDVRVDPAEHVVRYLGAGTALRTLSFAAGTEGSWHQKAFGTAAFSPDGRFLATVRTSDKSAALQLRDGRSGRVVRDVPRQSCGWEEHSAPTDLGDSGDSGGSGTLTGPGDEGVVAIGEESSYGESCLALLAFRADGDALAYGVNTRLSSGISERVFLIEATTGRRTRPLDIKLPQSVGDTTSVDVDGSTDVEGIAFGPDGKTLLTSITGHPDGLTRIWDLRHRARAEAIAGAGGRVLALRPDGRTLVTSGGQIVDLRSGKVTRHVTLTEQGSVSALAVSPNGARLAAGDGSGRVTVWSGRAERRLGVLPGTFDGAAARGSAPEPVSALAFSPDGATLALAGARGTLRLWDVASGQPLGGPLRTPGDPLLALRFSPDGGTLYAAGAHVALQRYAIGPSAVAADVCRRAGAALSRADWHTYLPDFPYRKTC